MFRRASQNLPQGRLRPKKWALRGAHSEFWRRPKRACASRTPWTPAPHTASTFVRNFICLALGHLKSQVLCGWVIIGWSTRYFALLRQSCTPQTGEALAHVEDAFLKACAVFADGFGVSSTIARSVQLNTDLCAIVIFSRVLLKINNFSRRFSGYRCRRRIWRVQVGCRLRLAHDVRIHFA